MEKKEVIAAHKNCAAVSGNSKRRANKYSIMFSYLFLYCAPVSLRTVTLLAGSQLHYQAHFFALASAVPKTKLQHPYTHIAALPTSALPPPPAHSFAVRLEPETHSGARKWQVTAKMAKSHLRASNVMKRVVDATRKQK